MKYSEHNSDISGFNGLMIKRPDYLELLKTATRRAPITALLGPRQTGITSLATNLHGKFRCKHS